MLAILIIILVLLGAAVVGSIYSNFLVFYSNFSEAENYHKAYYASVSALERGELVTKQRKPGYVGSGGFDLGKGKGGNPATHNGGSDKSLSGFSYLGTNKDESSVFRTINSRTTRIPAETKGDVERMLSADDSNNYNMMDYEDAEIFLLYYDNGDDNPYKNDTITINKSTPPQITGEIRLPQLLFNSGFGYLNTGTSSIGLSGSLPANDAIVDWQIRGTYSTSPFTIFSTQSLNIGGAIPKVNEHDDSVFREGDINNILKFSFGSIYRSPIQSPPHRGENIKNPTIIGQNVENLTNNSNGYEGIFTSSDTTGMQLRFSLLNLLGTGRYVYPFLEYYVDFGGVNVSDKYFTINGQGNFKDYQVNTIIQRPTTKESILGNFTSIF